MREKVAVAMSGGVDSSTTAYLLKEEGYDVLGIFLKFFRTNDDKERISCCGIQGREDARSVAKHIGIPFYVLNYEQSFQKEVIENFCLEYRNARTPNPCVLCNKKVKLGRLLQEMQIAEIQYVATGHYANIEYDKNIKRYLLKKGKDVAKDQSYFLYALNQVQLSRLKFPLGNYTKDEVRKIAQKAGLFVCDKPANQEICFIPDNDYKRFLLKRHPELNSPGYILFKDGKILGEHKGIAFYTIGQREGLGISHKKPLYVIKIDKNNNTIIVGEEEDLYSSELTACELNLIAVEKIIEPLKVKAKIRYNHKEAEAIAEKISDDRIKIKFKEPQRAITRGQSVVMYQDDTVIAGGIIEAEG
ncbi:MAG: tRNA 2-thiouridine(34) synthase MnmA [Candidatus Hydrogenedentota bacterium]